MNKKNFKIRRPQLLFHVLLWLCFVNTASAQVISEGSAIKPTIFSNSPQAASMGAYGGETVNMFTGQPDINIGLYTVSVGDYKFPISLNYNLSSVRPDEHPGFMGLGWNLVCNGVITRNVKGGVDEVVISGVSPNNKYSYYDNYATLDRSDWASSEFLNELVSKMRVISPIGDGIAYPAPDEFNFSVNGISGSFYKNHKGAWVVSSSNYPDLKITDELTQDYKIEVDGYTVPGGDRGFAKTFIIKRIIYGFTIVDANGIKYVFGKEPNSIDFSAPASETYDNNRPNFVAKAWYLTKIVLPTNEKIEFTYSFDHQPIFKLYKNLEAVNHRVNSGALETAYGTAAPTYSLTRDFYVYPSKITTSDLEIDFKLVRSNDLDYDFTNAPWEEYDSDHGEFFREYYKNTKHWYQLQSMNVKSLLTNEPIYELYPGFAENEPNSRLFLKSLYGFGRYHYFEYNENPLPPYASEKIDHWGFYNNLSYSLPYTYANLKNEYPLSRKPAADENIAQAGVLKKIKYPTGGSSTFFYEPHNFSKYVKGDLPSANFAVVQTANEQAGGLRVRKIVSDPEDGNTPVTREYFYVNDYINGDLNSSGVLAGKPTYFEEGTDGSGFSFFKLKSSAILQQNYTGGSHITYSKIYQKDADGGISEFVFSNHDNGFGDKAAKKYQFNFLTTAEEQGNLLNKLSFNSLGHERGKLLISKKYRSDHKILEKTEFRYDDNPARYDDLIRSIDFKSEMFGRVIQHGMFPLYEGFLTVDRISAYNIYSYHPYLKNKTTVKYALSAVDSIKVVEDYTYNNEISHQLRTVTSINSNDQVQKVEYKYPTDYPGSSVYQGMANNNIISPVIEQSESVGNELIKLTKSNYVDVSGNNTLYVQKSIQIQNGNGSLDTIYKFNRHDSYGNLLEQEQPNGSKTCYIWGYDNKYPVAEVKNASLGQFAFSNFEEIIDEGDPVQSNLILGDLMNNLTTNTSKTGKRSLVFPDGYSITTANKMPPGKYIVSYWSKGGYLSYAEGSNTGFSTHYSSNDGWVYTEDRITLLTTDNLIIYGSQEGGTIHVDDLRVYPENAQMTTYTYDPLIGITSQTDPKSQITYYQYDGFKRLKEVKDQKGKIIKNYDYQYRQDGSQ